MSWDFIMPKKEFKRRTQTKNGTSNSDDSELSRLREQRDLMRKQRERREEVSKLKGEIRREKYRPLYSAGSGLKKLGGKIRAKGERVSQNKDFMNMFSFQKPNKIKKSSGKNNDFMSGFDYWHKPIAKVKKKKRKNRNIIIRR